MDIALDSLTWQFLSAAVNGYTQRQNALPNTCLKLLAGVFTFWVPAKVLAGMATLLLLQHFNCIVPVLFNNAAPGLSDCKSERRDSGEKKYELW